MAVPVVRSSSHDSHWLRRKRDGEKKTKSLKRGISRDSVRFGKKNQKTDNSVKHHEYLT